jgi:hypothetical protein
MSDAIDRLIAILDGRAREMEELANDAHDLLEIELSKDTEDFLLHRAEIITSEISLLRKQLQQLINRLER